jgi:Ca-activated chloride channel family protein
VPRRWLLAAAAFLALMGGPASRWNLQAVAQRDAFRAGVDLISLSVTVTGPTQRYVSDLDRENFLILEDGVPQRLTLFGRTGVPLELALLLDTSASMETVLATAQEAAIGFARQLEPLDVATIVDFDSRVQILHDFTSDGVSLEQAIRKTTAGGSTALYNALYIALKELNKVRPEHDARLSSRRRAIVVLSDGEDTSSLVSFEEVLSLASRSDTVIYTIGLAASEPPGRQSSQDSQFILRRLAQQTGGRAFFPRDASDLAGVYGDIRAELSTQYSLAYESSSPKRDGQWRRIVVRVNRPNMAVRTRQGYYAPRK